MFCKTGDRVIFTNKRHAILRAARKKMVKKERDGGNSSVDIY